MKQRMKRFLSVLLSIAMVLAISLPVLAEEGKSTTTTVDNTNKFSTVYVSVTDDAKAEINLYKIFRLLDEVDEKDTTTVVNQAVSLAWISDALKDKVETYTPANPYSDTEPFKNGDLELTTPSVLNSLSQEEADAFYQWLAGVIESDEYNTDGDGNTVGATYGCVKVAATKDPTTKGTTTSYCFSDVPSGGYLALATNGVNVYHPTSVNLLPDKSGKDINWDISTDFSMKASTPTIEKTVTDVTDGLEADTSATAAIGDSLSYDIYTDVPKYSDDYEKAAIRYTMVDIISSAFTYVTNPGITITGYGADGAETTISSDYYTIDTTGNVYVDGDGNALFVSMDEGSEVFYWLDGGTMGSDVTTVSKAVAAYNTANTANINANDVTSSKEQYAIIVDFSGKFSKIADYEKIGFHYSVTVNDKIEAGAETNSNTATLAYTTNPQKPEDTSSVETTVKVYTYGVDVTKMDGASEEGLNNVKFDLYKKIGEMSISDYNDLVKNDSVNVYKSVAIEGSDNVAVYKRIQNDLLTGEIASGDADNSTTEKGKLIVEGLDVGDYLLVETDTVPGYNLLDAPVSFTIKQDEDNPTIANNQKSAYYTLTVKNYQGVTLPSTGGMGITMFVIIGMGLAGAAIIMLRMQRRKIYR